MELAVEAASSPATENLSRALRPNGLSFPLLAPGRIACRIRGTDTADETVDDGDPAVAPIEEEEEDEDEDEEEEEADAPGNVAYATLRSAARTDDNGVADGPSSDDVVDADATDVADATEVEGEDAAATTADEDEDNVEIGAPAAVDEEEVALPEVACVVACDESYVAMWNRAESGAMEAVSGSATPAIAGSAPAPAPAPAPCW